jgi:hypothetical protein
MSTETQTERESVLAMALRILQSLEALEEEHCDWREALAAQELLERYWDPEDPEEAEEYLEERETVRLYLERQAEEGYQSEYVSEDADPVMQWLESSLDLVTVLHSRGGETEPVRLGDTALLWRPQCWAGAGEGRPRDCLGGPLEPYRESPRPAGVAGQLPRGAGTVRETEEC